MARDQVEVMHALGFERFGVADQAGRQFDALRADLQKRRDEAGALARRAEEEEQARASATAPTT